MTKMVLKSEVEKENRKLLKQNKLLMKQDNDLISRLQTLEDEYRELRQKVNILWPTVIRMAAKQKEKEVQVKL